MWKSRNKHLQNKMHFLKSFCAILALIFSHEAASADQLKDRDIPDQASTLGYFSALEKVTPVLYRISQNSSEVPKKIPLPPSRRPLPKYLVLDLVLRRRGRPLRMRLHRMRDVIGAHTRVEWTDGKEMESKVLSQKCVYHGKVDNMENSLATVDLCNDLRGVIRTDHDDLYLQPMADNSYLDIKHLNDTNETGAVGGTHTIRIHRRQPETVDMHQTRVVVNLTHDTSHNQQGHNEVDDEAETDDGSAGVNGHRRHKRQTVHRGPRYMQVLLVTDSSLVRFHGRNLIEQYLLTQMSIVDNIYHHPSLGFEINLIVVKIKIIEDSVVKKLVVRGDGKESLDRFCQWSNDEKPKNRNKDEDFDVAVFITKEEIGPAGFAPVTGMCNPIRSCALVKDDGTSSAFVIAHEIGHIFGMIHDGQGNKCSDDPSDGKIMASMVQSNYHTYYWAPCNKEAMEKYLVDIHCLDDKPKDPQWPVYSQPYGQSWSLDEQCRQEFGSGYSLCRAFDHLDPCNHLWCSHSTNNTLCKTKRGPPLPGTSCGRGRWCMNGSCLEKRSVSVDGGWSSWQKWEGCSRTCGIGIQFRVRFCNQPRPKHGGRDCRGEREEFQPCNIQRCPHMTDFRSEQCTEFNEKRFDDSLRHHWQPHENKNVSEICKVTCISKETKTVFTSESNAIDGTFCSYDQSNQICIKGRCHEVGCDGVLRSRQREDQCGHCGGRGTSCRRITGHFADPLSKKEYHRLLVIPTGSRNIMITERQSMPHLAHFIAVRDSKTEVWYLNGNTQQESSRYFVVHGTGFTYSNKQRDGETLAAKGPLLAPLDIMVYSMSSKLPPAIDYDFVVPADSVHLPPGKLTEQNRFNPDQGRYVWAVSGWTNCSKPCGSGIQFEVFTCVDTEKRKYSDGFCSQLTKPREGKQECNTQPCSLHTYWWDSDDWSKASVCTSSCGSQGVQQRRVQCLTDNRGQTKPIDPAYCNQRLMPNYIQACNRFPCTTRSPPPNDATIVHISTSLDPFPAVKFVTPSTSTRQTQAHSGEARELRVPESTSTSSTKWISSTHSTPSTRNPSSTYITPSTLQPTSTHSTASSRSSSSTHSTPSTRSSSSTHSTSSTRNPSSTESTSSSRNPSNTHSTPVTRSSSSTQSTSSIRNPSSSHSMSSTRNPPSIYNASGNRNPSNTHITTRTHSPSSMHSLLSTRDLLSSDFSSIVRSSQSPSESETQTDLNPEAPELKKPNISVRLTSASNGRSSDIALNGSSKMADLESPVAIEFSHAGKSSQIRTIPELKGLKETRLALDGESEQISSPVRLPDVFEEADQFSATDSDIGTNLMSKFEDTELSDTTMKPHEVPVFGPAESPFSNVRRFDEIGVDLERTDPTRDTIIRSRYPGEGGADAPETLLPLDADRPKSITKRFESMVGNTEQPIDTTKATVRHLKTTAPKDPVPVKRINKNTSVSLIVNRPAKAKTTIRKRMLRRSSVHWRTSVDTRLPVTTTSVSPSESCLQDKSVAFCRLGANRDRCSKPSFFALCCLSCRAHTQPNV